MSQPTLIAASAQIHPTALLEDGVYVGERTSIWDSVHIRRGASLGNDCIVGEKTYIAYDVSVGDFVKINANAYICAGVSIEDFCMISAHVVFTNDRFPRSGDRALTGLETSQPTASTLQTRVRRGATIGANATIGPGIELGEFCMVGMGSVVTRDVGAHQLVLGSPARHVGWVCVCGRVLFSESQAEGQAAGQCPDCDRGYRFAEGELRQETREP